MDEWTDRDSDAVAAETVSRFCDWLIKSNFDIWNAASRASLTKMKESISCSLGHDTTASAPPPTNEDMLLDNSHTI